MAYDFKKAFSDWYLPKAKPSVVDIPGAPFLAVRGEGDPNDPAGDYQRALEMLYGVAYTLRMSPRAGHVIEGYYEYVVPPLEGLWLNKTIDLARKQDFRWISLLRLPDFITPSDLEWAREAASRKKRADFSRVEWFEYADGLCVQCMHTGTYDDEPETIDRLHRFMEEEGYAPGIDGSRFHHEIYLGDPRRTAPEKLRTVIRLPVQKTPHV